MLFEICYLRTITLILYKGRNWKKIRKTVMFLMQYRCLSNLIWILHKAQKLDFMPYYVVASPILISQIFGHLLDVATLLWLYATERKCCEGLAVHSSLTMALCNRAQVCKTAEVSLAGLSAIAGPLFLHYWIPFPPISGRHNLTPYDRFPDSETWSQTNHKLCINCLELKTVFMCSTGMTGHHLFIKY